MGNVGGQVTHGVSQMSGHNSVSLNDDMLNTKQMTIEDLVEANDVSFMNVAIIINPNLVYYYLL